MPLTVLPYIIIIIAFVLGGLVGCWLGYRTSSKTHLAQSSDDTIPHSDTVGNSAPFQDSGAELAQIEGRLKQVNALKAATQQHLDDHSQEHSRLLLSLEERRATVEEVRGDLQKTGHELAEYKQKISDLLVEIDRSQQELDMLDDMRDSVGAQVNQMTQQVHRQDSRLRMLRQTLKERSKEIVEMEALLEQRSATLRRLSGDRQRLDVDIAQAEQLIARQTERLQQLLQGTTDPEPDHNHEEHSRVDVTPSSPLYRLPSQFGDSLEDIGEDDEDDLTVIPALADFYARQLKAGGVKLIAQLAYADPDEIRKLLHDVPGHLNPGVEGWIQSARQILNERRNGQV